ncbi:helix-turn-helix transcriptional regulator [Rhodopseudomonas sp. HC1]|uniref:helix-turn-helix domain-containing protein n=1 Tax=Rhodopseudomonas infernalis TaxID=2897386 RepID=UPI001EE91A37|nr:helix-turn-helix transcriptional regulator [Rhodopseudomonas infernalis]MCG6205844.1 helix-turn-helix transcriptional regulator [Rhodopseudomonas infernalis]
MAQTGFGRRFPQRESIAVELLAMNMRRLRLAKGWSQDQLAAALEVEQGVISLIENRRANPTLLMLEAIADALGVQLIDLFEANSNPKARVQSARQVDR